MCNFWFLPRKIDKKKPCMYFMKQLIYILNFFWYGISNAMEQKRFPHTRMYISWEGRRLKLFKVFIHLNMHEYKLKFQPFQPCNVDVEQRRVIVCRSVCTYECGIFLVYLFKNVCSTFQFSSLCLYSLSAFINN